MARTKKNKQNLRVQTKDEKLIMQQKKQRLLEESAKNKKLTMIMSEESEHKTKKNGMLKHLLGKIGVDPDDKHLRFLTKKKEYHKGKFQEFKANSVCQADLLFMPNDNGYAYILVVVDNVSRAIDGEPLKAKSDVVAGMKAIFARKFIKPTFDVLQTDPGGEFSSKEFISYMHSKNIALRQGLTGRHDQQAIVESYNKLLGKVLNSKMSLHEIKVNQRSVLWKPYLKTIINELNKSYKHKAPLISQFFGHWKVISNKKHDELLQIHDKVHIALDEPRDITTNKKLSGKFRSADLRYSPAVHVIKNILYVPNSYPRYIISGPKFRNVSFTKAQLLETQDE